MSRIPGLGGDVVPDAIGADSGPRTFPTHADTNTSNPDEIILRRSPALVDLRDQLITQRRKLARLLRAADSLAGRKALTDELDGVRGELSMVEKRLTNARNELVENAVVVGMTPARSSTVCSGAGPPML